MGGKTKILGLLTAVLLGGQLLLTACGGTPEAQTPPPATQPTVTIDLVSHSFTGPGNALDQVLFWVFEETERRMNGRVKFNISKKYSESLVKASEMLDGLGNNVFDVAWMTPAYTPARLPFLNVVNSMPYVTGDAGAASYAMNQLAKWDQVLKNEIEANKVVYLGSAATDNFIILGTKPINSLEDVKGYRLRTLGLGAKAWQKLGGVPVSMTFPEAYSAMQTGTVDGVAGSVSASHWPNKTYEVGKYYSNLGIGSLPVPIFMSKAKWDTIPADIQKVILEVGQETPEASYKFLTEASNAELKEYQEKWGGKLVILPQSELDKAVVLGGQPVWDEVEAGLNAQGLPGTQGVDLILKSAKDYEKAHPRK